METCPGRDELSERLRRSGGKPDRTPKRGSTFKRPPPARPVVVSAPLIYGRNLGRSCAGRLRSEGVPGVWSGHDPRLEELGRLVRIEVVLLSVSEAWPRGPPAGRRRALARREWSLKDAGHIAHALIALDSIMDRRTSAPPPQR